MVIRVAVEQMDIEPMWDYDLQGFLLRDEWRIKSWAEVVQIPPPWTIIKVTIRGMK